MSNVNDDPLEITKFCQFATSMIGQIEQCPQHFRSVLLLSLLDSLSRSAFPRIRKNGERFVKLIDGFSGWIYRDYISLSQLDLLIDSDSRLKQFLTETLSKYEVGKILRPEQTDTPIDRVLQYSAPDEVDRVKKVRYAQLLWVLRNLLSHSFKSPGFGWRLSRYNSTPYYFHDLETMRWELYIDAEVLANIAKATISNLGDHFEKEQINPYERFSWSSSWLER